MSTSKAGRNWQEIAEAAQSHRDESIRQVDGRFLARNNNDLPLNVTQIPAQVLTDTDFETTELLPEQLLEKLSTGVISCVAATEAFLRRAALAQSLANCITELLPEMALKRAEELDHHFATYGKPIGALHGLPVSVKEHINMKGLGINGAFCAGWGTTAHTDAHILKILRDAGVVFYARTTEPQTVMHLETASNLYGTTVNPFNRNLTAGGSSGGEGALIGLRGSCLGIGSDIGGSIRSPAANNGLFGLRPTANRVPGDGIIIPPDGEEQILGVYGPLSTSLAGIDLFMSTLLSDEPWQTEPSLIPLPWRNSTSHLPSTLKVAVMWDDGIVTPHPTIQRALRETVDKLRNALDIEVVDWIPYKHDYGWRLISSLYFCDGGEAEKEEVAKSGEPWLPLSRWILTENPYVRHLGVKEVWALTAERNAYRAEYAAKWNDTATGRDKCGRLAGLVDVILCPVGPGVAPLLGHAKYWAYTSQWNLLDYPALVVPLGTRVDAERDSRDEEYVPRNSDDAFNHEIYDQGKYINAPLSLQIVGRPFDDEKVVQAAKRMSTYCDFRAA